MVKWLTSVLAILYAATLLAAQAPAEQRPAAEQPAAQQPAQQQPAQERPAPPAQAAQANKVTYTGCLKPGAAGAGWILENSEMASAANAAEKPGERPAGTSGVAGSKTTFNLGLGGKSDANLKSYANHKMEVVGTVSAASAAGAAPDAAPGASSTPPRQTLNVESVKEISATCQ
jgi:hypothetical protein